jgi:hypothetical protein
LRKKVKVNGKKVKSEVEEKQAKVKVKKKN